MTTQTVDGAQLVNGALAAFQARERDDAALLLARALQANPPLGARWASVSRLAATIGEITLALAAARKHVASTPTAEARCTGSPESRAGTLPKLRAVPRNPSRPITAAR